MPDLPPPLRDWLATQRTQLNGKFRLAQRRSPTLHAETATPSAASAVRTTASSSRVRRP